ncbi:MULTISPECIES: gamma carbonic anhydrase family protein [unclassified Sphingobium]|uniref:gamma carbonic anhydrase family protein n=1 Tax=unclassified Sphingobium TaxID=2611147 RepID=UPI0019131948|nr:MULTISPECIES: gamma carbonic anhydrase family protein [unclassified Sphingobium]
MDADSRIDVTAAAYVAPSAQLYGQVFVGEGSSIWHNVVARSEHQQIRIGRFSNIQDFTMIHVGSRQPTIVGDYCSITHRVTLHGCEVQDYCLIGIGATIMDGCVIGRGSIVAGHSFLPEGTEIPPHSIVMGSPAQVVKQRDASVQNLVNALLYHRNAVAFAQGNHRAWVGITPEAMKGEAMALARTLGLIAG